MAVKLHRRDIHRCMRLSLIRFGGWAVLGMLAFDVSLARPNKGPEVKQQATIPVSAQEKAQAPAAPEIGKTRAKATVPFEMLTTNHMMVEARINGKGPYRLIFDLGAPITLLDNRVSEASGVVKPNTPRSFLFGMRGEAEVDKLQVGDLIATKLPVIILDHPV